MTGRALLASLAVAAMPAVAEPPALEVTLEPASATVGDLVSATLTLRLPAADAELSPRFPDWSRGWGEAEVRTAAPPERTATADGVAWTQRLTLAAYRTGRLALPPVAVALPREPPLAVASPAGLALEIRSVLPQDPQAWQAQPPAPPTPLGVPRAFWWTAAALAAAGSAAALLARTRRAQRAAATLSRTPWQELARALEAIDPRHVESAHAALSLALRRYLGRSFAMPAAESSTSELGHRLAQHGLAPELVRRATRLLREIDEVKFARAPATGERFAARLAEAREVAQAVERHLHPPAPAEAAA